MSVYLINKNGGSLPFLSSQEADQAVRRLWRWSRGNHASILYAQPTASGREGLLRGGGTMVIDASKGWQHLSDSLAYVFFRMENPGKVATKPRLANYQRKVATEIFDRNWLTGKLKKPTEPEMSDLERATRRVLGAQEDRLRRLVVIDERMKNWSVKKKRAETYLAKLAKQRRALQKRIDEFENVRASAEQSVASASTHPNLFGG